MLLRFGVLTLSVRVLKHSFEGLVSLWLRGHLVLQGSELCAAHAPGRPSPTRWLAAACTFVADVVTCYGLAMLVDQIWLPDTVEITTLPSVCTTIFEFAFPLVAVDQRKLPVTWSLFAIDGTPS